MIHIDLNNSDVRISGTGEGLLEEYRAVTSRIMYLMNEAGMDKEWIHDVVFKNVNRSLASVFPEQEDTEDEVMNNIKNIVLSDFFKKG